MDTFDMLLWENVFRMPFTGMRLIVYLVAVAIVLLMCTKIVATRLPLYVRILFHGSAIAFVVMLFITEQALLSRPGVVSPIRLREGHLCLKVLSATVKYGKGVYMLVEEPNREPRYVHVLWEVRFAQAISRALRAQKINPRTIMVGNSACVQKQGGEPTEGTNGVGARDGVVVIDNFPTPYPDKVDLED